jgi:hypothetical protein
MEVNVQCNIPAILNLGKPRYPLGRRLGDPTSSLNMVAKRKLCPLPGDEPKSSSLQPNQCNSRATQINSMLDIDSIMRRYHVNLYDRYLML